ncbi:MAG: site-specific integrase [Bacteroidales bacterium]|nr:site-specific integrase [Bacteroidales bacterium]
MENPEVTTHIMLDKRREKQDGTYPVKLRVTYQRRQKYYRAHYSFTEEYYNGLFEPKIRGKKKERKIYLEEFEKKALKIIESLSEFTFSAFEKKFFSTKEDPFSVFEAYEAYIIILSNEGRANTASSYDCSLNSIKSFAKKQQLKFYDITPEWLKKYERWMEGKGNSPTTTGIYLRCLQALFNSAIAEGDISQSIYPFGKKKYQIPAGRNIKKALNLVEIEKIYCYKAIKGSNKQLARDLWVFSYLCNGINVKDILNLRYEDIDGDQIVFIRSKTKNTSKKELKPVVAILTKEAKSIIRRWQNKKRDLNNYVFPFLQKGMTAEQELAKVRNTIRMINENIKKIAVEMGIKKNVTTYTARHSFSTVLKRSGAPIEFISESLGHHDLKTTESYLDSFENDIKKEYSLKLTDFHKSTNDKG